MSQIWPFISLGNPAASTLVFLHGFLGRGADWLPVAQKLAADFHCLLPDLPGHGRNTDLDPELPLTFPLLSAGLARTLEAAGVVRPALIGYSLGGRLALQFGCRYPDRLATLVVESAQPGLRTEEERARRRLLDDARAERLRQAGLAEFLDEWYRADLWASLRARVDLLEDLIQDRTGIDVSGLAKALADLSPGRMDPLWDCLPDLAMPMLLLSGDLDLQYTAITAEAAGLIPGSVHARIPGAGHNIHLEQPEAFRAALESFFAGLENEFNLMRY